MIRNLEKGLAIIWFHRQNSVYSSYKEKCTWQLIQKFYSILHPDVISSHRSWIVSVIRAIIKKTEIPNELQSYKTKQFNIFKNTWNGAD